MPVRDRRAADPVRGAATPGSDVPCVRRRREAGGDRAGDRACVGAGPGCTRCGMPALEDVHGCRHCPPRPVARARAPFAYRGPARSALLRLKFNGWRAVAEALGRAMAAVHAGPADAVTWVPLSPGRRADRGYDQALALAAVVSKRLGLSLVPLLERVTDTPPQSSRGGAERRRAMRGAFRAIGGRAPPTRVLLVDDVLTTGATAAERASALRSAGALEVALLTAARATSEALPARCYHRVGLPTESVVARERGD